MLLFRNYIIFFRGEIGLYLQYTDISKTTINGMAHWHIVSYPLLIVLSKNYKLGIIFKLWS